nr:hypothetical protein [uncultured Amphritea sp.]
MHKGKQGKATVAINRIKKLYATEALPNNKARPKKSCKSDKKKRLRSLLLIKRGSKVGSTSTAKIVFRQRSQIEHDTL